MALVKTINWNGGAGGTNDLIVTTTPVIVEDVSAVGTVGAVAEASGTNVGASKWRQAAGTVSSNLGISMNGLAIKGPGAAGNDIWVGYVGRDF